MKQCNKCGIEKEENEYYINDKKRGYRKSQCKSCFNEYLGYRNKSKRGVYGIFSEEKCLYVGESSRLDERVTKHRSLIKKSHSRQYMPAQIQLYDFLDQYNNVKVKILEECNNHKERELHWNNKYQPLFLNCK